MKLTELTNKELAIVLIDSIEMQDLKLYRKVKAEMARRMREE